MSKEQTWAAISEPLMKSCGNCLRGGRDYNEECNGCRRPAREPNTRELKRDPITFAQSLASVMMIKPSEWIWDRETK